MLLSKSLLENILNALKISNFSVSLLKFQNLGQNNPKVFLTGYNKRNFTTLIPLVSYTNQGKLINISYSLGNVHSSVLGAVSQNTSDIKQSTSAKITSHDNLKENIPEEKVKIYFETMKGEKIECLASTNQNVMNASIANDIAMHGNCDGEAICSVCHVYIEEKYEQFMPKVSEDEAEMLDMVPNLQDNSRLSCQIKVRKELEGAVFKLPHYDGPSYENDR